MKFVILNCDYPEFLTWLYAQRRGLERQHYEEQIRVRNESLFGVADFYSRNLRELGHEAFDIHVNNEFMQGAWAREHGIRFETRPSSGMTWRARLQRIKYLASQTPLRRLKPIVQPVLRRLNGQTSWFFDILEAQIKYYRPDVVINQDMARVNGRFLQDLKPYLRLLVGQIASPLPAGEEFNSYDLIVSSLPNLVGYFRSKGVPSELHAFGFEPGVLKKLGESNKDISVSFVGSLSWDHESRIRLLEHLCDRLHVQVWGQGVEGLNGKSAIRRNYMGRAWGIEMYRVLRRSRITLNHHIGMAEAYANNMRLFEATGVGSLLVTDWKENLPEMFDPGKEVVTYRSPEECAEMIEYYLDHEEEREAIARAGQRRTLREHTYGQRIQELVQILERYL